MRTLGKWIGRLLLLVGIALVAFLLIAPGYVEKSRNSIVPHDPYPVSAQAQALHDTLLVGDWHADSLLWQRNIAKRGTRGQVDIPRLIEGGVAIQVFTAVTKSPKGQNYDNNAADAADNITPLAIGQLWPVRTWSSLLERALYQAEKLHAIADHAPDQLNVITSLAQLEAHLKAHAAGSQTIGGILGIEGAHPLQGDLANMDKLEAAGHRVIGLQHFFDNDLGGSLHGFSNRGLTDFGRLVVADIASRGMVLDLAHSSPQVAYDVLEMTDMPIIVSHTGIYGHCQAKRNFPDDLMRSIAQSGGVLGMGYWAEVACGDISPAGIAKMINAGVQAVGADHISLGSDFDGSVETAFDTSELAALTHALIEVGLSEEDIRKIMGGNMIRVLRARLK
jgi:microsomal dipeptidase-like Zn-dependent dipeptidase